MAVVIYLHVRRLSACRQRYFAMKRICAVLNTRSKMPPQISEFGRLLSAWPARSNAVSIADREGAIQI